MRRAPVVACLALLLGLAATAEARVPRPLRAGTRSAWASAGVGPALAFGDAISQTKLIQTLGVHFLGHSAGPALALELQESVGYDAFAFEVMPRFFWDIEVTEGVGFYITPSLGLGFIYLDDNRPPDADGTRLTDETDAKGVTVQLALEARLVINDRGLLFLRPVNIDIITAEYQKINGSSDWNTRVRWDVLMGGGVTF